MRIFDVHNIANATGTGVQKEKILEIDLTKDYNARNSIRQNIFSTIGVEVGFQTLLKQYDLVDGSYGIELKLTFYDGEKKKTQEEKVVFADFSSGGAKPRPWAQPCLFQSQVFATPHSNGGTP